MGFFMVLLCSIYRYWGISSQAVPVFRLLLFHRSIQSMLKAMGELFTKQDLVTGTLDTRCADEKHTAEGLRTLDPIIMNAIFSEYLGDHSNLSK